MRNEKKAEITFIYTVSFDRENFPLKVLTHNLGC